jgi:hypothetical protein
MTLFLWIVGSAAAAAVAVAVAGFIVWVCSSPRRSYPE